MNSLPPKMNILAPEEITEKLHGGPIKNKTAKLLLRKYREKNKDDGTVPKKTWSVSFNIDDFEYLISMIQEAGDQADGFNVNFGIYSEDGEERTYPTTHEDWKGRQTVVFVLAKKGKDVIDFSKPIGGDDDYNSYNHGDLNP